MHLTCARNARNAQGTCRDSFHEPFHARSPDAASVNTVSDDARRLPSVRVKPGAWPYRAGELSLGEPAPSITTLVQEHGVAPGSRGLVYRVPGLRLLADCGAHGMLDLKPGQCGPLTEARGGGFVAELAPCLCARHPIPQMP